MARRVLVALGAAPRNPFQDLPRDPAVFGLDRFEPDVRDLDVAGEERAGRHVVADLLAVEGDGHVRVDRGAGHLAGRRVNAGRKIDAEHGRSEVVDLLDQPRRCGTRLALEPGAEERVDQDVGVAEILLLVLRLRVDHGHVATRFLEHARSHPAVAAVRAAAADDGELPGVAEVLERVLRNRSARALHQLVDGSGIGLLRRAHLGRGVERLTHRGRRPGRPPSRGPSSATSRGRSPRRAPCRPTPSSARRASRPASAGRRSRSRAT